MSGITNDKSRDKSYIPGAPVTSETNRDKTYVLGAPVTPVKPCSNAAQAEAASRPVQNDAHSSIIATQAACGDANELNSDACIRNREQGPLRTEQLELGLDLGFAAQLLPGLLGRDSEHFSADELGTSDEESQGSAASAASASSNQGSAAAVGHASSTRREDDGIRSMERKRKLFAGDDAGISIIAGPPGKGDGRAPSNAERVPRRNSKGQVPHLFRAESITPLLFLPPTCRAEIISLSLQRFVS